MMLLMMLLPVPVTFVYFATREDYVPDSPRGSVLLSHTDQNATPGSSTPGVQRTYCIN